MKVVVVMIGCNDIDVVFFGELLIEYMIFEWIS